MDTSPLHLTIGDLTTSCADPVTLRLLQELQIHSELLLTDYGSWRLIDYLPLVFQSKMSRNDLANLIPKPLVLEMKVRDLAGSQVFEICQQLILVREHRSLSMTDRNRSLRVFLNEYAVHKPFVAPGGQKGRRQPQRKSGSTWDRSNLFHGID